MADPIHHGDWGRLEKDLEASAAVVEASKFSQGFFLRAKTKELRVNVLKQFFIQTTQTEQRLVRQMTTPILSRESHNCFVNFNG